LSINPYQDFNFKAPNYLPIIQKRAKTLKELKSNKKLLTAYYTHYKTNPVDFIQDWLMTYDPRNVGTSIPAYMPFILFPKQADFINWLYEKLLNKEDGLAEKCRDVGFTWLCVGFSVWAFVFIDGVKIGWGSRKADLVDKKDNPDSIFEKLREAIKSVPDIFLPRFKVPGTKKIRAFNIKDDSPFMRMINHKTGATITGEGGDNIGRGGRSTMYFLDETDYVENLRSTLAALSQNSDVKIYFSTYAGTGEFYRMRNSGNYDVFTFRWTDDPRKTQKWFDKEKLKTDPVIFAREVEMNAQASVSNLFIPNMWITSAINFVQNPSGVKTMGYDVAGGSDDEKIKGDNFAMAVMQGISLIHIEDWKYSDSDTTKDTQKVYFYGKFNNVEYINFDSIGVGAGAFGEFKRLRAEQNDIYAQRVTIKGVNVANGASDEFSEELGHKYNERLLNLKAELWWNLRTRFRKTHEHVSGQMVHPLDELISIPNYEELINELSAPKLITNDNGKYMVENKKSLGKRGIKSPNLADALALCFRKKDTFSLDNF
jgi:hypothetical protein